MPSLSIPLGPWEPDVADIGANVLDVAQNVYPHANGYKPIPSLVAQSDALSSNPKGMWYVHKQGGNVDVYAATTTKLYRLDSSDGSWTDVSRSSGGDYALPSGALWSAVQYGTYFIVTNSADDPQVIEIESGTNFAAVPDSPGPAKFVTVMDNRVVLGNLSSDETAIKWSDINDHTNWSSGVADTQSFPDHGTVQGVFPHAKMIMLQNGTRQVIYTGDTTSFQFPELTVTKGTLVPYGSVELGTLAFWWSADGFYLGNAMEQRNISQQRITRYFASRVEMSRLGQIQGTHDPFGSRILIAYPTGSTDYNDRVLIYDWSLDRWTEMAVDTFILARAATASVTLEGLDSISASLDALTVSLDSPRWRGGIPALTAMNSDKKMAYFEGTPLAATLRTGGHSLVPGWRSRVQEVYPVTEGDSDTGTTLTIGTRTKSGEAAIQGNPVSPQASGYFKCNADARFHDFQYDIPAGLSWSNVQGFDPVTFVRTSQR